MREIMLLQAAWLQDVTSAASDAHWTMIFVGIVALCCVIVILALIGVVIAALRVRAIAAEAVANATRKAAPLLTEANTLFHEVGPHVRKISANVASISETVKGKVNQFDQTLTDVNDRTKAQVARVDGMVNEALTTTSDIASTLQRGVRAPIREFAEVKEVFKAAVDVLSGKDRDESVADATRTGTHAAQTAANSVTPISPRTRSSSAAVPASDPLRDQ